MGNADCFIAFESDVSGIELPERFTFPFYYEPHPLSILASLQLQKYISSQPWNKQLRSSDSVGIMFGVLVVQNKAGEVGFLAAFSGKLAGSNHHTGFVPPVFDILVKDGFFLQEEKHINQLNWRIESLEASAELASARAEYKNLRIKNEEELASARKNIKLGKQSRKAKRLEATKTLSNSEVNDLEKELVKQSLDHQYAYKRLAAQLRGEVEVAKTSLGVLESEIEALKQERLHRSNTLQNQIFEKYAFLNKLGVSKSLRSIFKHRSDKLPPAGAGECAAPKLLQHAYLNDFQPIAMAEFWWGNPLTSEVRKHGQYYPACRGKCEPILGHMLQGLDIDDNPMLEELKGEKSLDIIFEDEFLVAINKPSELLSVPGKTVKDSVYSRIKELYPEADGPLIIHRLDMSTSGVLLLAKTKDVHKAIQRQFEKRTIKKRYIALLDGELTENHGEINLPLRVDLDDRPRQLVCFEHGKKAETRWELVQVEDGRSRVYFYPITGRTHQLRVHAAHADGLNIAILGDDIYGIKANRLHLHAEQLQFVHPISKKEVTLKVAAPF